MTATSLILLIMLRTHPLNTIIIQCNFFCIVASVLGRTYYKKFNITPPILAALCHNVVSAYWLNAYTVGRCFSTALDL